MNHTFKRIFKISMVIRQRENAILAKYVHFWFWSVRPYNPLPFGYSSFECERAFHVHDCSSYDSTRCIHTSDISCRMNQITSIFNQHVNTTENICFDICNRQKEFFIHSFIKTNSKVSFRLEMEMERLSLMYLLNYIHRSYCSTRNTEEHYLEKKNTYFQFPSNE